MNALLIFLNSITAESIQITFLYEKVNIDSNLKFLISNIVDAYNHKIFQPLGVSLKVKDIKFYDEYKQNNPQLAQCAGSNNIDCRIKHCNIKNTVFMFLSLKNDNQIVNLHTYSEVSLCMGRYFINIYDEDDIFKITSNSINTYLTNLLGMPIENLIANTTKGLSIIKSKMNIKNELEKCIYFLSSKNTLNLISEDKFKNSITNLYYNNKSNIPKSTFITASKPNNNYKTRYISKKDMDSSSFELYKHITIEDPLLISTDSITSINDNPSKIYSKSQKLAKNIEK